MTNIFEWLSSGASVNLIIAFLIVAVYAIFQLISSHNQTRDRARAGASGGSARGNSQSETPRSKQSTTARGRPLSPLGDGPLSKDAFRVLKQYPTLSLDCGALFAERGNSALEKGVSLNSDALKVLREAANVGKVYLILCDSITNGFLEAIVRSALETVNIVGNGNGQVPQHRLLVCTTVPGKVAIVRQLETSLHIECDQSVHEELSRFGVTQWYVMPPGSTGSLADKVKAA
jgi:hypothetical protein